MNKVQPVWRSPSVTVVLSESRRDDRCAVIEQRKNSGQHYRLKIVIAADSIDELKATARRVGFRSFVDTPRTIK